MARLLFDFPSVPGGAPERRSFQDPERVIRADSVEDVMPALNRLRSGVREGFWAAGYLAYEAAPAFEPAFRVHRDPNGPLLWFGLFDPDSIARAREDRSTVAATENVAGAANGSPFGSWTLDLPEPELIDRIRRIRRAIEAGETYQVNLTARMSAPLRAPLGSLYERLRAAQGSGYHALLELGDRTILSASPELFFRLRDGEVVTRPMKGTSARGRWLEEDRERARELRMSEKEQAENRMIVDLIRNDLGRICQVGSIEVVQALEVERYRTVLQMTSSVRGRVGDDTDFVDVLAALFPCGSVTGAPKIHTMGLIAEMEASPRDVYCGAIGYVEGGTGNAVFNVPIRTLLHQRSSDRVAYGVGSGVTWSSTPAGELAEFRTKARILEERWPDFSLLESLRLEDGRLLRMDRHLSRLAASAEYFDRILPEAELRRSLRAAADAHSRGSWKVRLLVDAEGMIEVEVLPLDGTGAGVGAGGLVEPWPVELATRPVDARDPFLFHKTTHRDVYEQHRRDHPGAADVLLLNQEGHVTEFTRGNVAARIGGRWITPPRRCGLLAGCFREELLDEGLIEEGILTVDDLRRAEDLRLMNSVREWVPVRLSLPDAGQEGDQEGRHRSRSRRELA